MALPVECQSELTSAARRLVEGLPATEEGALNAVLEALTGLRDFDAVEVIRAALLSRDTTQKEAYVSMLEDFGIDDGAEELRKVLRAGKEDSNRPDLAVTIRALHALRCEGAVEQVAEYVAHVNRSVRAIAAEFLYEFADGAVAGPVCAEQLAREPDPRVAETLADALARWGWTFD
ncbi:HEAT repeat protein [Actinokineospora baliensis]|uniref:HEAT repeat domain-containing protein n=1 Tax=Actinokineospora baliensis TaxID=547056 RepID=UPI00195903A4|nr:hypothetical protein [Actinokineospora baliensis]MBM7773838.1 HEAT repeat protein [Actinokineospora baliensis]